MKQSTKIARLLATSAVCAAFILPVAAQAKPQPAQQEAKMVGKQIHRATTQRTDADKVVDALTLPEKKVFHGMSEAEKSVARHMAHIGKQVFR